MKLFAMGDLHLAHTAQKPMNIFSTKWDNHREKIKENWERLVTEEDVVILCGDLSWAMRLDEAEEDLKFIDSLPGKKICIKGNHDYWWHKVTKLNTLFEHIYFLQNTAFIIHNVAICGTRGWLCPQDENFTEEDFKIYAREKQRLALSLKAAQHQKVDHIVVALHYPPTNGKGEDSFFTELIESYGVKQVVYGHLHDDVSWNLCVQGQRRDVDYKLVAADYVAFTPQYLMEIDESKGKEKQ